MTTIARRLLAASALLSLVLPTAATSAAAVPTTSAIERARVDAVPTPTLHWTACDLGECAIGRVPLDYDDPNGPSVEIALTRIPARDPSRRLGSLFLNPGGPGASGTEFPQRAREWLGAEVQDRFDLIGMDPRGLGRSTNTQCFPSVRMLDRVTSTLIGLTFPVKPVEEVRFMGAAAALSLSCSGFGRQVASAISTAQVARDLDVLRRAVGDRQLSYLGFSYGTYLGQVYANLFPDRVRALALDGVIDPREWVGAPANAEVPMTVRMDSATATSDALDEVLRRCEAAPTVCGVPNARATFDRVAAALRKAPFTVDDPEGAYQVTYQQFITATVFSLYSKEGAENIPLLAATLDQVRASSGSGSAAERTSHGARFQRLAKQALEQASRYSNVVELVPVVMCSDSLNPRHVWRWKDLAEREDARNPYVGRFWLWNSVYCARDVWGAQDEDAYQGPFNKWTANPVLVVGSLHDPATSYRAASAVSRLLPNSRLLTSNNWGHTGYGISACTTAAVDRYLIERRLPPPATICSDAAQPYQG